MNAARVSGFLIASLVVALGRAAPAASPATQPARSFAIRVVDEQTGRGVPLVELKTVSNERYYTDSAGLAAVDDPGLFGQNVFFSISSHGYDYPKDGFGMRGARLDVSPGGSATIKIRRINIAERLYRITGEGIYRDSVMLGRPTPLEHPVLDAQVIGQDSVQAVVYRGKIRWFWGDTGRIGYPLGHFGTAGAVSDLPGQGGLDPSLGVNLRYFTAPDGFSRPMVPRPANLLRWLDGLMLIDDEQGHQRLVGAVGLFKNLGDCRGRELVVYDDQTDTFDKLADIPRDQTLFPRGHPRRVDVDGSNYYYFGDAFPTERVRGDWKSLKDFAGYEAFTCLAPGTKKGERNPRLDRDAAGRIVWGWKKNVPPVDPRQLLRLVESGQLPQDEARFLPLDVQTRRPIVLGMGSVTYNAYRKKWIQIAGQLGGSTSYLGEIWYSEADRPEGPWKWARKIVTHDHYSFYNPVHHPFFDQQGGRVIFFEGTYATTFSRAPEPTPRYDYNQVMYRLDLSDPRLRFPERAAP